MGKEQWDEVLGGSLLLAVAGQGLGSRQHVTLPTIRPLGWVASNQGDELGLFDGSCSKDANAGGPYTELCKAGTEPLKQKGGFFFFLLLWFHRANV